ncbi:MAG: hypothetical protein ACRC3Y_10605 [Romboutsia sp.]|uniref:hypothetical protein n=1 Tax=Romboutsia sp. TaxID=1965302 RepID=UPI003F317693
MKKILIGLLTVLALGLVGCNNTNLTEKEIIQVSNENSKIEKLAKSVSSLENSIYNFINDDIKEKESSITELELENMEYEITKARDNYNGIKFDLIERYCKSLENNDEKSKINYDLSTIQTMKIEFENIINLYEQMIKLGEDTSYSNSDYDKIDEYEYDVIKSVHKVNLFISDFDEFFEFYGLFTYDVGIKTLTEVENIIKNSGYKYEYENNDEGSESLQSLIVSDKNSADSITFQGYLNDSEEYELILVQYNIGKTGSSVSIGTYSFLGLSDKIEYRGYNVKEKDKPEFNNLEEQYVYLQSIIDKN